jgi:hypothetical protein
MTDLPLLRLLEGRDREIDRLREQLVAQEKEKEVMAALLDDKTDRIAHLKEELELLTRAHDKYKGALRFLAGEGITVARRALEEK